MWCKSVISVHFWNGSPEQKESVKNIVCGKNGWLPRGHGLAIDFDFSPDTRSVRPDVGIEFGDDPSSCMQGMQAVHSSDPNELTLHFGTANGLIETDVLHQF